MQNISFTNDGLKLDAVVFTPSEKKDKYPAILFVHGWTSEKERSYQYAEALTNLGYLSFLVDMRGHGRSEGDRMATTNEEFLSDVLVAYDQLSQLKNVDTDNINAIGSSFGGYLVALLAAKRKVKNLVLRAPANYPDKDLAVLKSETGVDNSVTMTWRKQPLQANENAALGAVHDFEGKILLIESEFDERIPHQTIMNYANAVPNQDQLTHVVMKGAPHSIKEGKFRDEVTRILVEWFTDKV